MTTKLKQEVSKGQRHYTLAFCFGLTLFFKIVSMSFQIRRESQHVVLSHLDGLDEMVRTEINSIENQYIIVSSPDPIKTDRRLRWFQRIHSPLDDLPSSPAIGISLFPKDDHFRLMEDDLFSILWVACHDRYPIMVHLDGQSDEDIRRLLSIDMISDTPLILCISHDWNKERLVQIDKLIRRGNVFWDVTHASSSVINVKPFELVHPVLPSLIDPNCGPDSTSLNRLINLLNKEG